MSFNTGDVHEPTWDPTDPRAGASVGTVTTSFATMPATFPVSSPLNTTGTAQVPIVNAAGDEHGILVWTVNPDGTAAALFSIDGSGAVTAGGMPAGWSVAGPGAAAAAGDSYDYEKMGELRVGDVEGGAADGIRLQVVRTTAAGVTTISTVDSDGTVNGARPLFGQTAAAAALLATTLAFQAVTGAHTWNAVDTITAWTVFVPEGASATIDGVAVAGPFGLASERPELGDAAATVPVVATTGSVYISTQTVA